MEDFKIKRCLSIKGDNFLLQVLFDWVPWNQSQIIPMVEKEAQVFLTNHTTLRNWSNLYLVWLSKESYIMLMIEFIFLLDFNECQLNNAGCEHICANSEGSYNCDCRKGFKLKDDKFGCEGKFGIRSLFAWEKNQTNDSVNDKHYVLISDGWVGRKLEWVEGMLLSSFFFSFFFFFFKFKGALEPKREACLKLMADMNYC